MHPLVARVAITSVSCFFALMLIAGSVGSATASTQQDDRCASKYIPLIQNAGLDIKKSAPTLGCRPDGNGNWWMPTAASLVDESAFQQLDPHGKSLLAAIDRMSMDDAFTSSVRYDRANATAITIGPYNHVVEIDISDAPMIDGPTWLHKLAGRV